MASAGKDLNSGAPTTAREYPSWARVIELVDSRRQESLRYNRTQFGKIQRYYDTYRGVMKSSRSSFRNDVSIPFTFAMIQSDVARKVQTSFGAWPIVSFEGYAPEDAASAKKAEILVSAQMKDCDSVIRAIDFFLQADICGTGVLRYGWKNVTRKNRVTSYEQIAPGLSVPVRRDYTAEIFNGPTWEVVDRLDFWQQPARKRIDDMAWVIHRYWADVDDLMEDAEGPYPYFDRAAVRMLKDFPVTTGGQTELQQRQLAYRNEYDYMARQNERFAKPVEIWEMHGLVPSEFATSGIRSRCIAIGNERVVLKNRESQIPNQAKPFIACSPMSDGYGFDGISKAEVAYGPQKTADRINNQKLDSVDLLLDNQWVVSNTANINTQNLFSRTGRVILVDGPADDTNIRPLAPDMRNVQLGNAEIAQLFGFMQLGTGETESLMGGGGGDRETARGFLGRQENALTRVAMESLAIEQGMVEPLANAFWELDRRLLPKPYDKVIGSVSQVNPLTGLPYQERVTVDEDDFAADYKARAVGASQMLGRSIRQQDYIAFSQMLMANPAALQIVNWANWLKQGFQLFDYPNFQDFLNSQPSMVNMMAMQQGQGAPQDGSGSTNGDGSLQQLSPDTLGQLMNVQPNQPLAGIS
jgi:hypothetical protein